ncbi:glycosyltransferase family 2 protein [Marivirga arenosa]|uniref:Glycosyltransferase family 2 protein n=1 Tax=Marivirga arenosa TaxID=3059076 RepID=A0AA49GJ31_9BACT|nr:glycosyltransferase family 2 protein [Marivirga sp. ABR2-2]WKK86755.2 glycosyltransferase family 2 protein [Marivirga sp. ABR2-2]
MSSFISIITPFYQSEQYLGAAVASVLNQSYENWELLLINDGSTDSSKEIALSYKDSRIRYFEQENKGVSAARNLGLKNMKGDYFCFLDADDALTKDSLYHRLKVFEENPEVAFVDGRVFKMNQHLEKIEEDWLPSFRGNPFIDLIHLTGKSFLGLTWMIKSKLLEDHSLKKGLTHGEDLLFYMQLAKKGGIYAYTERTILYYRNNSNSAMKNLQGLESGYRYIENQIKNWDETSSRDLNIYRFKYKKAMFLAYLRNLEIINAVKAVF